MTEVPEFWWNREQKEESDGKYEYIYISESKTDLTPYKSEKFYIGRYTCTGTSSEVTCKSGVANLVNMTITDLRTSSKNIGTNWGLMDILRWSLIQMLYLVEYADYNSQSKIGIGYSNTNTSALNTGSLNNFKMKSGSDNPTKSTSGIIYRGIENLWGNLSQMIDGVYGRNYTYNVCYNRNNYADDSAP